MAEKRKSLDSMTLADVEQALLDAQREHDTLVVESSARIADLMAARDAKLEERRQLEAAEGRDRFQELLAGARKDLKSLADEAQADLEAEARDAKL